MKDSNMMTTLARFETAPVTVTEAKMNIFAPVDKISNIKKYQIYTTIYEDNYFKVSVSGTRLTQIHRDILDIALFYGSNYIEKKVEESIPIRTFSLYSIQKHLQHKHKKNQAWIIEKFKELKRATISIYEKKNEEEIEFNIIRVAKRSDKLKEYILVFEELYFNFFEKSISISYKKLLFEILSLKNPQTKSIVRYMISFQKGHQINIDTLLKKIGVQGGQRNINIVRKLVLDELTKVGHKFNISLQKTTQDQRRKNDITLKYTRHNDVVIFYPKKL